MSFQFFEDFKVQDERNRSYRLLIEESTALSRAHALINDKGRYHVALNGNKHILKTPAVQNFTLSMDFELTCLKNEFGYGLQYHFRYDREKRVGHHLECFWDKDDVFHVALNDRVVFHDKKSTGLINTPAKAELTVMGNEGTLKIADWQVRFDIPEGNDYPDRGQVAFDSCFCPGGTLLVDALSFSTDDPLKKHRVGKPLRYTLACVQGMTEPLRFELDFFRYDSGEVEMEYVIDGTINRRGERIDVGGKAWGHETDFISDPYIRLEAGMSEIENLYLWRNERRLYDPLAFGKCMHIFPPPSWPQKGNLLFFSFPEKFTAAAGYGHLRHLPWWFAENGPYEMIRDQDDNLIYEGNSIRGKKVAVMVKSPPDKRIVSMIPKDIPEYSRAIEHAVKEHYFFTSETIAFSFETWSRSNAYDAEEFETEIIFADAYGEPVDDAEFTLSDLETTEHTCGFLVTRRTVSLCRNLPCGVWRLQIKVRTGQQVRCDCVTVFEVLSDDPDGVCPPLASGLPEMFPVPNETKWLESDGFDPLGAWGGYGHYFSGACRYPAVARKLQIWRLLKLYRRKWMLMLHNRGTDDTDIDSPINDELIRHADYVDAQDTFFIGRYELFAAYHYTKGLLQLLKQFVQEKKPPLKLLDVAAIEKIQEGKGGLTTELFRDLFENAWRDWRTYFAANIKLEVNKFVDRLLEKNPKAGRASYGPEPIYCANYKSAYTLRYGGYPVEDDQRLRDNGSFWFLEEYHYSCDYPVSSGAFFVATYKLMYPYGRKIYPEIYCHGVMGCNDGAVFQAHPPFGLYQVPFTHYKRLVYQYAYGTPQFKNGKSAYWRDYGFHTPRLDKGSLDNLVYAWGKLVRNKPDTPLKAPFLLTDPDQFDRTDEYQETEYSFRIKGHGGLEFVCNTAEEALAWAHERLSTEGYNSPVVTTMAELDAITPEMAEFMVIPPIVPGTPNELVQAMRRLHQRGVNLICFEEVAGLEDFFGVKRRNDGGIQVTKAGSEVFSHKKAVAYYDCHDAEVILKGGENGEIPLVMVKNTAHGKTAFFNLPPTVVRKESLRERFSHGRKSVSQEMPQAFKKVCQALCAQPAVYAERGGIFAARTENHDIVVILTEDSPIYGDTTSYPVSFRFSISEPGIGKMKIESDAEYSIVRREDDLIVLRTDTAKDDALFFRFSQQN